MRQTFTHRDDRGRAVDIPIETDVALLRRDGVPAASIQGLKRARARVARRKGVMSVRRFLVMMGLIAIVSCGLFGVSLLGAASQPGWSVQASNPALIAMGIIFAVFVFLINGWIEKRPSPGSTRCLACAYDLSSAHVADDGCTVCPECGAAWRLPVLATDAMSSE